jgi:hypothetical protein
VKTIADIPFLEQIGTPDPEYFWKPGKVGGPILLHKDSDKIKYFRILHFYWNASSSEKPLVVKYCAAFGLS